MKLKARCFILPMLTIITYAVLTFMCNNSIIWNNYENIITDIYNRNLWDNLTRDQKHHTKYE